MSYSARNTKSIPMKDAFESFLKVYNLKSKFNETYLIAYWERIMGASIAKRTEKIYIKSGVLFIRLNSAPLSQELLLAKTKLIQLLNTEIGEKVINDVVFI
jgi:predicted nucleic acid-binding Zn ribbon protein